jgi:hypothetical protein
MLRESSSKIIGFANVKYESLRIVEEVDSRFCSKLTMMLHFHVKWHHCVLESEFSLSVMERLMINWSFPPKQHIR